MSATPIPLHRRRHYNAEELAIADAGDPALARRMRNRRREPGESFATLGLKPLSELLTPEMVRVAGLGIHPELEWIAVIEQRAGEAVRLAEAA